MTKCLAGAHKSYRSGGPATTVAAFVMRSLLHPKTTLAPTLFKVAFFLLHLGLLMALGLLAAGAGDGYR